jgi:ABC-type glutathione transport system ATPase component
MSQLLQAVKRLLHRQGRVIVKVSHPPALDTQKPDKVKVIAKGHAKVSKP